MNTNLNPNPLVRFLGKPKHEFTKADIVRYVKENNIEMINLRYAGADGRLKTLNFIINDEDYLDSILTCGERVDGSSLFPYIEAGSSDLYVVPRYRTAFLNPFSEIPAIDILCSYYTKDGTPLEMSPEYTLRKAHNELKRVTGLNFHVMGELEYYVVTPKESLFLADDQRGYHESTPFNKGAELRATAMKYIAEAGGLIKYGHSEVGNFTKDDLMYEQNEIEFLPVPAEQAADQLMLAKWIIRNLGHSYGYEVTFAPKITEGKAGSGMHIHMKIVKNGVNMMLDHGKLSVDARKAIAGMMVLAPSITAFGNKVPTSYFRLVPHQEAPTNVCWGDRDMCSAANPLEKANHRDHPEKQTVEMRSPDASADIYQLLASLCVAVRTGFELDNALEIADRCYVDVDIHKEENKAKAEALEHLPANCSESADCLLAQRAYYEKYGIFSPEMIDGVVARLKAYNDRELVKKAKEDHSLMSEIVETYLHCG